VAVSFKYGAEALALIGIAYGLIRWVGRSLRSQISDRSHETARLSALGGEMPSLGAEALVKQGLVSADELTRMSPREREFLVATAGQHLKGPVASVRTVGKRPTPSSNDAVVVTTTTRIDRTGESTRPPRLHLITPTRPPLGMAVHCPGCGSPLDRDALQRVGTAACQRCKRPVSAHIQRGRLTVIIEESTDEAAYRRQLEGTQ
jgi:hypothetical protein